MSFDSNFGFSRIVFPITKIIKEMLLLDSCHHNKQLYSLQILVFFQAVYQGKSVDLVHLFDITNFPRSFYYGKYKVNVTFKKKDEIQGCVTLVIDIKRPWEIE